MSPIEPQAEILEVLNRHGVDFIVVGGVAAVLHGAPLITFDTDIVHSRDKANVLRLLQALAELEAYYREHEDRKPFPEASWLMARGHHLLATKLGPLDVLCVLTHDRDFDALTAHSEVVEIADGVSVRVATLEMLIRLKEELHRDKDRAVLPTLRHTLEQREKQRERRRSSQE